MKRHLKSLSLLAFLFCASAEAKTLNVRMVEPPVSLDWTGLATMLEAPMLLNLNDGLFIWEYPSEKLVPALAESLQKSKDLKEYTFKIRKDAKWSDGRPVYAQDFADSWLKLISPQSNSIYIYYLFDIVNAKEYNSRAVADASSVGIKAIDDHTLKITFKKPVPAWEKNTAFWPLFPIRKDLIAKYGANWWRAGVLVSSGPFVFESYEAGKKAVFKRNPFYKKLNSDVDEVDFYFVPDHQEALKKYEDGTFPFLWNLSPKLIEKYKGKPEFQSHPLMRIHLLALNSQRFPMTSREFRLAILKSLDPAQLIPEDASQLKPTRTLIASPLPGSRSPTTHLLNVSEALAHLNKSGVSTGKTFKLRILTGIAEPSHSVGNLMQAQLSKNLGINVDLDALRGQEYTTFMNLGEYHATLITWTAKVMNSQDFLLPYSGEAAYNRMNFRNASYDQWISEGSHALNPKEAEIKFFEAQKLISMDEAVAIPLFIETQFNLVSKKLKRIYFNHMGVPILRDATLGSDRQ
jgi:oligopeptide transport system substrate-binding protein